MQKKKLFASLTLLALGLYGCQMPSSGVSPAGGPQALVVDSAIVGQVRDAQGNPVAGALVQALPAGTGPQRTPYGAVTDGSGRFAVAVPRTGVFNLTVQSVQLGQAAIKYNLLAGSSVDVDLTPTGVFTGTLDPGSSGLSIAGALVFIPGTNYVAVADEVGSHWLAAACDHPLVFLRQSHRWIQAPPPAARAGGR